MRWTDSRSWHLTLLFLGSTDPVHVPALRLLVDEVAARSAPFAARADLGGGRLQRGEGVAWLGLSAGADMVISVAQRTAERCPPGLTEGPPPRRTPSAHVTLVRRADRAVIEALRDQAHGPLGAGWTIDRICLVRSHLERDGAHYETLHEATM